MALTEERKGQIALLVLKHRIRENGVNISKNFRREIGNVASAIGISTNEAMDFAQLLVQEAVNDIFRANASTR